MQEKTKPAFVVAPANNISMLTLSCYEKGRFDEIFFLDLPNEEERKNIFKIHLFTVEESERFIFPSEMPFKKT